MTILAQVLLLLSRFSLWLVRSRTLVCIVLLVFYPLGTASLYPALVVAVKRFSTQQSRPYAFAIFYAGLNAACIVATGSLNVLRNTYSDSSDVYSWVLCMGVVSCVCGLL